MRFWQAQGETYRPQDVMVTTHSAMAVSGACTMCWCMFCACRLPCQWRQCCAGRCDAVHGWSTEEQCRRCR